MMRHCGQYGDLPVTALRREPEPRHRLRARHEHPLHAHRTSRFRNGQQEITTSTTTTGETSTQVMHVMDGNLRAQDNGRKRHIAVDTIGLLLTVLVTAAGVQDRDGARPLLWNLRKAFRTVRQAWADSGYAGKLVTWAKTRLKLKLLIVPRTELHKFIVLPRRWVVERTFAWITRSRRTVRDYERLPAHHETIVYWSMIIIMSRRLARHNQSHQLHPT